MSKNPNYVNLMNQITKLKQQADMIRSEEVKSVIQDMKSQMAKYGITVSDLADGVQITLEKKVVHPRSKPIAKFKDPVTGAMWTGRGKIPAWMKPALEKGMNKNHFAIN